MKSHIIKAISITLLFVIIPFRANSNIITPFWLGIDAKVETNVSVDQKVLDTINNLPIKLREQIVIAGNDLINKADNKFRLNVELISEKLLIISLQTAVDMECSGKNVIDKFFSEIRKSFPKFLWLSDNCEKQFLPDKLGPGPEEKVKIAECWIYEKINTETSPDIIAAKLSKLELMSNDAACRLRGTKASKGMWITKADFGVRYTVWSNLQTDCDNAKSCEKRRSDETIYILEHADERDISNAKDYFVSGKKRIANNSNCNLQCYESSLVDYHYAEATINTNKGIRIRSSEKEFEQATHESISAAENASKAKKLAENLKNLEQYNEIVGLTKKHTNNAVTHCNKGIVLDPNKTIKYEKISKGISTIKNTLLDAEKILKRTKKKEQKRIADLLKAADQKREEEEQRRLDIIDLKGNKY